MKEIYSELSKIKFSSLFEELSNEGDGIITLIPKQGFHKNQNKEIFKIKKINNKVIITDSGITYANLDYVYELSEPDVIKNLKMILHQTKIKWYGKEFIYELNPSEALYPQILSYLQGINFLYTMKIFYN